MHYYENLTCSVFTFLHILYSIEKVQRFLKIEVEIVVEISVLGPPEFEKVLFTNYSIDFHYKHINCANIDKGLGTKRGFEKQAP